MSVETRGLLRIIYIDVLDSFQGSVRAREQEPADMGVAVWRRVHGPTLLGYPCRILILYHFFEC